MKVNRQILIVFSILLLFESSCNRIVNKSSGKIINGNYQILNTSRIQVNDSNCVIYGFVEDVFTNSKIDYAIISIINSNIYYVSDNSLGTFYLRVPHGEYQLKAECVGNTSLITPKIIFKPNQKYEIVFRLGTTIIY